MALVLADRVKETSTTAGTGTLTLSGASAGFQSFAAVGNGNTTYYAISDAATGQWEVGIGTYTSSGTTLSRDTVLSSSASGALVTFGAGSKDVFVTYPSEKGVWLDAAGKFVQTTFTNLSATGTATISTASLTSGTIATAPTGIADIANKAYVDLMSSTAISVHAPVKYESPNTTGNLTATYVNGGTTPTWTDITTNTDVVTGSAHGLSVNDVIVFGSTTNGITAGTPYFVFSTPTATSISLSLNYNGAQITTLVNGTGLTITSLANPGIGATLTNAGTKAALVVDGVTVSTTDRVLIYNQTNAFENGVYTVTTVGTPDPGGTNWVLTRATDSDTYAPNSTVSLGQGDYFFVQAGNTGKGESYILTTIGTIVFGTTGLVFNQFGSSQVYTAGTGLTLTNTEFSITPVGTASTYGSASQVPVITTNASGQVSSVTNTTIAITGSQVSGNITGQAGSVANALTAGTYLTSGGTFDGSVARTFTVDATSANTASKVVARDASGNFSAGTVTAALTGNATTATTSTNVAGGAANRIVYNTAASTTGYAVAPTVASTLLNWNGSAFTWVSATTALGFTPVQQGGGTGQGANKLYIGWLGSALGLTVDSTNFSSTWPISVTGSAVNVAGGAASQLHYQTGVGTTGFIANGTSGQFLQSNGASVPTWVAAPGAQAGGVIYENSLVISSNYTLTTAKNGMSVGPITINSGVSVTVPSGQRWLVF